MSGYLTRLEAFPDLEGSIIRATKIYKVLKRIIRLASIPKDDEYNFKKRCHALLTKWNKILRDDPEGGADEGDESKLEGETNGVSKDGEALAEKADEAEVEKAAAPEVKKEVLEKKIGTTVEGEKEAEEATTGEEIKKEVKLTGKTETDEPNIETKPEEGYQPPSAPVEATA